MAITALLDEIGELSLLAPCAAAAGAVVRRCALRPQPCRCAQPARQHYEEVLAGRFAPTYPTARGVSIQCRRRARYDHGAWPSARVRTLWSARARRNISIWERPELACHIGTGVRGGGAAAAARAHTLRGGALQQQTARRQQREDGRPPGVRGARRSAGEVTEGSGILDRTAGALDARSPAFQRPGPVLASMAWPCAQCGARHRPLIPRRERPATSFLRLPLSYHTTAAARRHVGAAMRGGCHTPDARHVVISRASAVNGQIFSY